MVVSIRNCLLAACAVGLLLSGGMDGAFAQSAADVIKERKTLMRNNSGNVKAIGAYLKKGQGSAADVGVWARRIAANAARIPDLFTKGSSAADGVGKTRAKPVIWMDRAKFEANAANLSKLAWNLSAAALTGDKKKIGAAMGNLGKNACGACHRAFRAPRKR